ncbi:hypothetical protein [Streptomyces sp. NPDC000351]|uniref:hypothetical protein n=1 Tax=Streptomyces sp. NPDC000351 TaxID=3154250 RepID=UPI00332E5028
MLTKSRQHLKPDRDALLAENAPVHRPEGTPRDRPAPDRLSPAPPSGVHRPLRAVVHRLVRPVVHLPP